MALRSFEGTLPKVADSAWVDETALVIGDVTLGEDSSIWPMTVARGDIHSITIGDRTNIQDSSILHVTHAGEFAPEGHALAVGDDVTVGWRNGLSITGSDFELKAGGRIQADWAFYSAEDEVEDVLDRPMEDGPGHDGARVAIGQTRAGRYLRVVYVRDPDASGAFVITAFELRGKPLKALRRRQRRRR